MDKVQAIKSLAASGHSERQIARALGISRKAVRRHLGRSEPKETQAPTGEAPTGSTAPKDTEAPTGSESTAEVAAGDDSRSLCRVYHAAIVAKLDQGLTAQRIHEDLCEVHGFTAKYSSVRRYVRQLGERTELPFRRMEVDPGYEMQVDYGSGVALRGSRRKAAPHPCVPARAELLAQGLQ